MSKFGLVLEGGGLRGEYTAGVLDAFLDNDISFPYCIGVSAGVCNVVSFLSHQKGRSRDINIRYMKDSRYFGLKNYLHTGSVFGAKMMFDTIPHQLMPFDYNTYEQSGCKLIAGVTDIETGQALYYELNGLRKKYDIVRATSSLPFVSSIVKYDGKLLLDGGITDPIPIKKSIADGNNFNVIVLTQHKGYKKAPTKLYRLAKRKYHNYPKFVEALKNRYLIYNDTLAYIDNLEKIKEAFVIRPSHPIEIGRFKKSPDALRKIYDLGYQDTMNQLEQLNQFLSKCALV